MGASSCSIPTMNNDTTKKMLERDPFITALYNIECRDATHCVNGLEDGTEPARVWAMNEGHANEIAKALASRGFTDITVEEV